MEPAWFRPRTYRHFDCPVGLPFAQKVLSPDFVKRHSWSPLISYIKRQKRYKPKEHRTVFKDRTIMYASHRDACIFSYYAYQLTEILDVRYKKHGLSDAVIAYRALGKSNYHFSSHVRDFARGHSPCVSLCFDVTGFFDNLDHRLLKRQLIDAIGRESLPDDWYAVFKAATKFRHIPRVILEDNPTIHARLQAEAREPIATMAEIKAAAISIEENTSGFGIPQGTPISAVFSNLYMWELDLAMVKACADYGAFYQRYSDDILFICSPTAEAALIEVLVSTLRALKLELKDEKTVRAVYDPRTPQTFQYLGFNIAPDGILIRPGSLARQWRKARRCLRRTKKIGAAAIEAGTADKIYTKKLRKRLLPTGARNFSTYARRSAKEFGSKKIIRQVRRLERMVENALDSMKS